MDESIPEDSDMYVSPLRLTKAQREWLRYLALKGMTRHVPSGTRRVLIDRGLAVLWFDKSVKITPAGRAEVQKP